jgi:hypothetical protein
MLREAKVVEYVENNMPVCAGSKALKRRIKLARREPDVALKV